MSTAQEQPDRRHAESDGAAQLQALIRELESLQPGSGAVNAAAVLDRFQPQALVAIRRQLALCRRFDAALFDLVTADIPDRPPLAALVEQREVVPIGTGWWTLPPVTRERFLAEWQTSAQADWQAWNQRIGLALAERTTPDAHLDALYYLAAAPAPAAAVDRFREWYRQADDRFDLAQCHALLEMLRLQEATRGPELSAEWLEYARYYASRQLFEDDYYKTGSYYERDGTFAAARAVIDPHQPRTSGPWILHLHATGGAGKTMFLRWLVARSLVPERVPCALVDFDDFDLDAVVDRPLQLFLRIVEQWDVQVGGTALTSLRQLLTKEQSVPGWNANLVDEIALYFRHAGFTTPVVVILDTLEEATLTARKWLSECVAQLSAIHDVVPELRVILSGRYNVSERDVALPPGATLVYELPRFTSDDAHSYLGARGIGPGAVRDAIVDRSRADDEPADAGGGSDRPEDHRFNPFKLAIFAEIALNRGDALTAAEVERLPRADIGYLLERVVMRISSQPLRWVIRYGVIARHLSEDFVERVLLPPLRTALHGQAADATSSGLADDYIDVWQPDPALADAVTASSVWEQLKAYARERGWISLVSVGATRQLRFHPEVVKPMRDLLRQQPIHGALQASALRYFESRVDGVANPEDLEDAARDRAEAVYHCHQIEGPAARHYWRRQVAAARMRQPGDAWIVASDVTRRDYADVRRVPVAGVTTAEALADAHVATANLVMEAAGLAFTARHPLWREFSEAVEAAEDIARDLGIALVPAFLRAIRDAAREADTDRAVALLEASLARTSVRHERVLVQAQLASRLAAISAPAASANYRDVLAELDRGADVGAVITPFDVHLAMAAHYHRLGAHTAVVEAYRHAATTAVDVEKRATLLEEQVAYAIGIDDLDTADKRLDELRGLPAGVHRSAASLPLLQAGLAWARDEPQATLDTAWRAQSAATTRLDRAESFEREGDGHALRLSFGAALSAWERAASEFDAVSGDETGSLNDAGWCAFRAARLQLLEMGNVQEAENILEGTIRQTERGEPRLVTGLQLLRMLPQPAGSASLFASDYRRLLARAQEWPALPRAEVLLFGLLFGLEAVDEDFIDELIDAVVAVQPPSSRMTIFDWAEHVEYPITVDARVLSRLLALVHAPKADSSRIVRSYLRRAYLCRALGHHEEAVAQLERLDGLWKRRKDEKRLIQWWRINRARARLDLPTDFGALHRALVRTPLEHSGLYAAVRIAAVAEALRDKQFAEATTLLALGISPLDKEPPNRWQRAFEELEARRQRDGGTFAPDPTDQLLAEIARTDANEEAAASAPALAFESASPHAAVPSRLSPAQAVAPPPRIEAPHSSESRFIAEGPETITIRAADAEWLQMGPDNLRHRLTEDWRSLAQQMAETLQRVAPNRFTAPHALRVEGNAADLPWELAIAVAPLALFWRSAEDRPTVAPRRLSEDGSVHILYPDRSSTTHTYEGTTGGSLEEMYGRHGIRPKVSFNPHPEYLASALQPAPTVLHIVAGLRESTAGAYLDLLGGAESPDFSKTNRPQLTASVLSRTLSTVDPAPFVVLDIVHPGNDAEAARLVVLRNSFARHLCSQRRVRGVLGTGLAHPVERLDIAQHVVRGLLTKTPFEALSAVRAAVAPPGSSDQLTFVLSRAGASLWMADPLDRLFAEEY